MERSLLRLAALLAVAAAAFASRSASGAIAQSELAAASNCRRRSYLGGPVEFAFDKLPLLGRSAATPWPGPYWPTYLDAINYRVDGPNTPNAYARAFGLDAERLQRTVSRTWGLDSLRGRRPACRASPDCPGSSVCSEGVCVYTWEAPRPPRSRALR
eukprot:tig00021796_g23554.t1